MDWKKEVKPPANICPQGFCFSWNDNTKQCRTTFGICKRENSAISTLDLYEPCEPELEKANLPWFYFISNEDILVEELKEEYLRESKRLWKLNSRKN